MLLKAEQLIRFHLVLLAGSFISSSERKNVSEVACLIWSFLTVERIYQMFSWLQVCPVIKHRLKCQLNMDGNSRYAMTSRITSNKLVNFFGSWNFHSCNKENTNSYHRGLLSGLNKIVLVKCMVDSIHLNASLIMMKNKF